jgi:hypothetical protein
VWAAFNVTPEGGVSEELQAAQIHGEPAKTLAPEPYISKALDAIRQTSAARFGIQLVRDHEHVPQILERTHRFRAVDEQGLFALAKDLARLTADLFDVQSLNTLLGSKSDQKVGSLKGVERLVAREIGEERARTLMSPLFGIYDLRLGDAHLPRTDQESAFERAKVDRRLPLVHQGWQLVASCVSTLFAIARVLQVNAGDEPSSGA